MSYSAATQYAQPGLPKEVVINYAVSGNVHKLIVPGKEGIARGKFLTGVHDDSVLEMIATYCTRCVPEGGQVTVRGTGTEAEQKLKHAVNIVQAMEGGRSELSLAGRLIKFDVRTRK